MKTISLITAFVFTLQTIVFASPAFIYNAKVPKRYGRTKRIYAAKGNKNIILIEDAHTSVEAQKNIKNIIESLNEKLNLQNGISLGIEGAEGNLDTTLISTFPYEKIKDKVLKSYVKDGKVSGAEYEAFLRGDRYKFYGLEDKELYEKNYRAYEKSLRERKRVVKELEEVKEGFVEKLFDMEGEEFKTAFNKVVEYVKDKCEFGDYYVFLTGKTRSLGIDLIKYPLFLHFGEILNKLDGKGVEENRNVLDNVDYTALMEEMREIGERVLLKLSKDKELVKRYIEVDMLIELLRLNISYRYRDKYLNIKPDRYLTDKIIGIEGVLDDVREFYKYAEARNKSLVANALKNLSSAGEEESGYIVVGGYHTDGICEELKRLGVSYAVVSPNVGEMGKRLSYDLLMNSNRDMYMELIKSSINTLQAVRPSFPIGDRSSGVYFQKEIGAELFGEGAREKIGRFGEEGFSNVEYKDELRESGWKLSGLYNISKIYEIGEDLGIIEVEVNDKGKVYKVIKGDIEGKRRDEFIRRVRKVLGNKAREGVYIGADGEKLLAEIRRYGELSEEERDIYVRDLLDKLPKVNGIGIKADRRIIKEILKVKGDAISETIDMGEKENTATLSGVGEDEFNELYEPILLEIYKEETDSKYEATGQLRRSAVISRNIMQKAFGKTWPAYIRKLNKEFGESFFEEAEKEGLGGCDYGDLHNFGNDVAHIVTSHTILNELVKKAKADNEGKVYRNDEKYQKILELISKKIKDSRYFNEKGGVREEDILKILNKDKVNKSLKYLIKGMEREILYEKDKEKNSRSDRANRFNKKADSRVISNRQRKPGLNNKIKMITSIVIGGLFFGMAKIAESATHYASYVSHATGVSDILMTGAWILSVGMMILKIGIEEDKKGELKRTLVRFLKNAHGNLNNLSEDDIRKARDAMRGYINSGILNEVSGEEREFLKEFAESIVKNGEEADKLADMAIEKFIDKLNSKSRSGNNGDNGTEEEWCDWEDDDSSADIPLSSVNLERLNRLKKLKSNKDRQGLLLLIREIQGWKEEDALKWEFGGKEMMYVEKLLEVRKIKEAIKIMDEIYEFCSMPLLPYLENYTSKKAVEKFEPVVNRDKLMKHIKSECLNKKGKLLVLIGESGAGKTLIAKEFARQIYEGESGYPELNEYKMLSLDTMKFNVAARNPMTTPENVVSELVNFVKKYNKGKVILYIDGGHILTKKGGFPIDFYGKIRTELENSDVRVILSTTPRGYSKILKKDSALNERIIQRKIRAVSKGKTARVLKKNKNTFGKDDMSLPSWVTNRILDIRLPNLKDKVDIVDGTDSRKIIYVKRDFDLEFLSSIGGHFERYDIHFYEKQSYISYKCYIDNILRERGMVYLLRNSNGLVYCINSGNEMVVPVAGEDMDKEATVYEKSKNIFNAMLKKNGCMNIEEFAKEIGEYSGDKVFKKLVLKIFRRDKVEEYFGRGKGLSDKGEKISNITGFVMRLSRKLKSMRKDEVNNIIRKIDDMSIGDIEILTVGSKLNRFIEDSLKNYKSKKYLLVNGRVLVSDYNMKEGKIFGEDGMRLKATAVNTFLREQISEIKEEYEDRGKEIKIIVYLNRADKDEELILKEYLRGSGIEEWVVGKDMSRINEKLSAKGIGIEDICGIVSDNRGDKDAYEYYVESGKLKKWQYKELNPNVEYILRRVGGNKYRKSATLYDAGVAILEKDERISLESRVVEVSKDIANRVIKYMNEVKKYNGAIKTAA